MYDVLIKNGDIKQYLHLHETPTADEKIPNGTIQEEINAISSFTFSIYPNNPCYDRLKPYATLIDVINTKKNTYAFRGRVLKVSPSMDNDGMTYKNVVCESRLAYLCDSIQPYRAEKYYEGDEERNGLQEFIDVILENHNAQVDDGRKIYRGIVTVNPFASSDNVYKGLNYEKTIDIIKNKLIGSYGGEIDIREADGLLYLDYVEKFGETRATTIELAKNIESQSREIDATSIITRLIPLGAKQTETVITTDDDGNEIQQEVETEERLTIESVNNGVNYIEDVNAVKLYGAIYGTVVWDDVTDANNLKSKGEAYLAENNTVQISDTVSALDLSLIGLDIDDFALYDSYPVHNSLLSVNDTLRIVKKTTNVVEGYASTFTLGNSSKALSDTLIDFENAFSEWSRSESQIKTDIKNQNNSIVSYVNTKSSTIEKNVDEIILGVKSETVSSDEYGSFKEIIKNVLSMDENGTTMLFQTINEAIAEVDGKAQSNHNSILKYIRFEDGNIILGEQGNAITLTISNDRMSFLQNGVEVAYLSDNNLYIGNAVIKAGGTLQLGNFAFVPRSDGSLSFLKVGG